MTDEPFDRIAVQILATAAGDVFDLVPEARSIAIAVDYYGTRNDDPAVFKRFWLARRHEFDGPADDGFDPRVGPVRTADAVVAGMAVTIRLLGDQLARAAAVEQQLRQAVLAQARRLEGGAHGQEEAQGGVSSAGQEGHAGAGGVPEQGDPGGIARAAED